MNQYFYQNIENLKLIPNEEIVLSLLNKFENKGIKINREIVIKFFYICNKQRL